MYKAGTNIAMKVPAHQYEATVAFYRDVLKLPLLADKAPDIAFEFGAMTLWIDNMPALSQAEIWMEIVTDDLARAKAELQAGGAVLCEKVEPLSEGFAGCWMLNPAQIVHLVRQHQP